MPHYIVRFELENGDLSDYHALEEYIHPFNFSGYIQSEEGKFHILPTGEYRISGEFNLNKVLDLAILASAQLDKKSKILVTESNGTAWAGLTMA